MAFPIELLGQARLADLERERERIQRASLVETCRRWVLGILPVARPCDTAAC